MWCRVGDEKWSEIRYGKQLEDLNVGRIEEANTKKISLLFFTPVVCGGKIYATLASRGLTIYPEWWSIEIVDEPRVRVVLNRINNGIRQPTMHGSSSGYKQYEVESDGEIFVVRCMKSGDPGFKDIFKIDVNKLNFRTMRWELLQRLEGRSFFVCEDYCLSCRVNGPGYIYFTREIDKSLYCYSMEDESISVSLPCTNLPTPWRSPIWIMPSQPPLRLQEEDCCNDRNEARNDTLSKDYCEENLVKSIEYEKLVSEGSDQLPTDVLEEVAKHLEPLDYLNFRAASRICRSLAPPVNWRTSLLGSENSLPYPFLMLKDRTWYNLVDPITNHRYVMKTPEILNNDTTIHYSDYGWLVMSRGRDVHLYNPMTKDVFSTRISNEDGFFLASKPSSSDCYFVGFEFLSTKVCVNTYYPSTNTSTRHDLHSKNMFFPTIDSPVLYQDAFYYVDFCSGDIGKLKLEDYTWEVQDNQQNPPCRCFQYSYLVECGGELLSVFVECVGRWVRVYKLNQSKTAWDIVSDLGNYNLYVSPSSSLSVMANPGAARNRIFLPRFRDNGIVFYSLDTQKWHSFGSDDSFNDLYGTKLMLHSYWIKPSWC